MDQRLFRVEEIAQQLGVSRASVYAYIRGGELSATRLGRATRVAPEDLEVFVARKREESRVPA